MVSKSEEGATPAAGAGAIAGARGTATPRLESVTPKKSPGYSARAWRRFRRNKLSLVALCIFALITLISFSAPLVSKFITKQDPASQSLMTKLAKPGSTVQTIKIGGPQSGQRVTQKHWLGSDELGRDVLTRLVYGGRISLSVAFITLILALTIGLLIGSAAGYFGGWTDSILMRAVDVVISVPSLFILILISSMLNNNQLVTRSAIYTNYGWLLLPFVIAAFSWTGISRLIRGEFLSLKSRDYVEAARVLGATNGRIIFRHILPNVVPIIIVWATLIVPGLIILEATLSYLGFGVQIPTPSWGNMLTNANEFLLNPKGRFLMFIPGITIFITALMVNLLGNGLRDALDPRLND
ncbi:MAG: ABC transporter permease [Thermomicrobiales bacterium]